MKEVNLKLAIILLFIAVSFQGIGQSNSVPIAKKVQMDCQRVAVKFIDNLKRHKIDSCLLLFDPADLKDGREDTFVKVLKNFRVFMTKEYDDDISMVKLARSSAKEGGRIAFYYTIGNYKANGTLGIEIDPTTKRIRNLYFPKEIAKYKYE